MTVNNQEDPELVQKVENYIIKGGGFMIDPRIFRILDNTDSSEAEISSIENMMDVKLSLRLRNIANSVYYGMQRRGKTTKFSDVITSIGMQPAKMFIIAMALFSRLEGKHKMLDVESFAISLFAKLIAEQMNLSLTDREKAELGGLFLNLGKVAIALYESSKMVEIDPSFIEKNHRQFAIKIIQNFPLPEFVAEVIMEDRLVLQKNALSIQGIVYLAQALVEKIIHDFGIIDIKSPMPDLRDNLESTLGLKISDYFDLIGLGTYLNIIRC